MMVTWGGTKLARARFRLPQANLFRHFVASDICPRLGIYDLRDGGRPLRFLKNHLLTSRNTKLAVELAEPFIQLPEETCHDEVAS